MRETEQQIRSKDFCTNNLFFIIQNEKLHLPKVINNTAGMYTDRICGVYTNILGVYIAEYIVFIEPSSKLIHRIF